MTQKPLTPLYLSLLAPGAGQFKLGRRTWAGGLLLGCIFAIALIIVHLAHGLAMFESARGSFLFACLLRGLVFAYCYAAFDSYFSVANPDPRTVKRRQAMILNMLLPGAGYLLIRAWPRMITVTLLLVMVVFFAGRAARIIDVVFVVMQVIMAVIVYHEMVQQQMREDQKAMQLPDLTHHPVGQLICLALFGIAIVAVGWIVQQRMPDIAFKSLTIDDVKLRPHGNTLGVHIAKVGLDVSVIGAGWLLDPKPRGALFTAEHDSGGVIHLAVEEIEPFMRPERHVAQFIKRLAKRQQITLVKLTSTVVSKIPAWKLQLKSALGTPSQMIMVIRGAAAYMLFFSCELDACEALKPSFEKTSASWRFGTAR